jgi:hypothetical protein
MNKIRYFDLQGRSWGQLAGMRHIATLWHFFSNMGRNFANKFAAIWKYEPEIKKHQIHLKKSYEKSEEFY